MTSGTEVQLKADHEYSAGHNIYLLPADNFISNTLAWLGEPGRHRFTELIGEVLDEFGNDYTDHRAWADILYHW